MTAVIAAALSNYPNDELGSRVGTQSPYVETRHPFVVI